MPLAQLVHEQAYTPVYLLEVVHHALREFAG
jgi:hypothetical protein